MQITHDEARWLIEYDSDRALNSEKQRGLTEHLQECEACHRHAVEMNDVENVLRSVMQKHWSHAPLPLPMEMDSIKIRSKGGVSPFAWRISLTSVAMVTFLFLIWGLKITAFNSSDQLPLGSLPVPTPSVQLTTPSAISTQCDSVIYEVQEFDTLDNIADQFFVSREDIMAFNNMRSDKIYASMELSIPQCSITPTDTARTPTTTLTPNIQITIFTSG